MSEILPNVNRTIRAHASQIIDRAGRVNSVAGTVNPGTVPAPWIVTDDPSGDRIVAGVNSVCKVLTVGWNVGGHFTGLPADTVGFIRCKLTDNGAVTPDIVFGLNSNWTEAHYRDIDYAWYRTDTFGNIFESGTSRGNFVPEFGVTDSTIFEIERYEISPGVYGIKYWHDSTLYRTVTTGVPTGAMDGHVSIFDNSCAIDIEITY